MAAGDEGAALLDRMIGQMIMVGFPGAGERDKGVAAVRDELAAGTIGGVVLYPENIGRPRQLRNLTAFLANAKSELVPLIAVDQEGGQVQRLTRRNGNIYFPSARDVAARPKLKTHDGALHLYEAMGRELAGAGINVNFGPVLDLNVNPQNPVIGKRKRSYGTDPTTVANLARGLHRRPSRGQCGHGGEALPRPRLESHRQSQGAGRHLAQLAREGDQALRHARP